MKKIFACVLVSTLMSACAGVQGIPSRANTLNVDRSESYELAITALSGNAGTPDERQAARNMIIAHALSEIDRHYAAFVQSIYSQTRTYDIASEGTVLALNAAGTFATGGDTGQIISAIAAITGGVNATYNRHVLGDSTVPALIATMDANRLRVETRILTAMARPESDYTLVHALRDLEAYYNAGTLVRAVASITSRASNEREAEQTTQDDVLERIYFAENLQNQVRTIVTDIRSLTADQLERFGSTPLFEGVDRPSDWAELDLSAQQQFYIQNLFFRGGDYRTSGNLSQWQSAIEAAR